MTPDYAACLTVLYPDATWSLNGNDLGTLSWDGPGAAPSQATLDAAWPQVQYEREHAAVEAQRRARYQSETDGMFFAAQRENGDLTEWVAAVDQIKADLPYPVQP
jgi:hypothetical protein